MQFVLKLALRYFFAKSGDRFISFVSGFCLLGTSIGVAALIIVMSIMNGFHEELIKCIIGTNGHIVVKSSESGQYLDDLKEKIIKHEFVKNVGFLIEGQGLISSQNDDSRLNVQKSFGVVVRGLSIEDFSFKKQLVDNVQGNKDQLGESEAILLGKELALNLGSYIGDTVRLMVPQTRSSIFGSLPKSKEFKVIGIITSGLSDYDSLNVIIPIKTAEKIFSSSKALEIYTDNPSKVDKYTKILYKNLNQYISSISNWQISNSSILRALKIEKTAMSMVLSLIIMVASFNIVSSLFMLVKDKNKDIAILKTIGASEKSIMLIFILNGSITGFLGTFIGIFIALPVASNIDGLRGYLEYFSGVQIFDSAIYFLYTLPAKILPSDVLLVSLISISVSIVATIYPAYRASKLNPVEILRYE